MILTSSLEIARLLHSKGRICWLVKQSHLLIVMIVLSCQIFCKGKKPWSNEVLFFDLNFCEVVLHFLELFVRHIICAHKLV